MVDKTGSLASFFAHAAAHPLAEVRCAHAQRGAPRVGCQVFKYVLTVVDVASQFKETEPLTSKRSDEITQAVGRIWARGPLKLPKLLQVDPGCKFMGAVARAMKSPGTAIWRGHPKIDRDQSIVERLKTSASGALLF